MGDDSDAKRYFFPELIAARIKAGLPQGDVAARMGTIVGEDILLRLLWI